MRFASFNHVQLLRYAGLFTWACVGIPLLRRYWLSEDGNTAIEIAGWWLSYLAFGLSYWLITRDLGKRYHWLLQLPMLAVLNAAAIGIGYFSHSGLSGILLLVIAGVLPWLLPFWAGVVWLILQNFSLVPVFIYRVEGFDWFDALLQSGLYFGFSGFTFVTSLVARQQADSREEQRRLNSELRATRTLLTESSRIGERMRISRELHDLVGHHLTALSLNLEVASHLVSGNAKEHVRQAQSVAKLLLSDVREVVSQLREDDAIDLTEALKTLVEGVPGLVIHLQLPPRFSVDDPRRAQVLLRCAQEIITNALRHANARNLWLSFERDGAELAIHAQDDGRGADELHHGNGLTGMRERLAQIGGRLNITTARNSGFALDAWLPLESAR
ncbi:MAG: sensor histidine kinase [Proteobacteria bacterium]|nr:sensor histidine kinase [Pseudomonadota bacterium]